MPQVRFLLAKYLHHYENGKIHTHRSLQGDLWQYYIEIRFQKGNGLSNEYKGSYGLPYSGEIQYLMIDREGGIFVKREDFADYVNEMLIDEFMKDWNARTGISWQKTCRMNYDKFLELATKCKYLDKDSYSIKKIFQI